MITKFNSQWGKILRQMKSRPKWYTVMDFNGAGETFVGYKAPTRLNELVRNGLVVSKPRFKKIDHTWFSGYRLAEDVEMKKIQNNLIAI